MSHEPDTLFESYGLTKRELFAAMAMQGQLGVPRFWEKDGSTAENVAKCAVVLADALLAELGKEKSSD